MEDPQIIVEKLRIAQAVSGRTVSIDWQKKETIRGAIEQWGQTFSQVYTIVTKAISESHDSKS